MILCVGIDLIFSVIIIISAFVYHFEVGAVRYHIMFNYDCICIIIKYRVSVISNVTRVFFWLCDLDRSSTVQFFDMGCYAYRRYLKII